ncbi:Zinc finger C2H2 domain containing protein [Gracilaria domingensis]|nr:Zinc finger C2H2 domain containing protein [Gracilaria domingensis]
MVSPAPEKQSEEKISLEGPEECRSLHSADDAARTVKEMVAMMKNMDPEVVRRLVQARTAAESIHLAFPGGDQRFTDMECDIDDMDDDQNVEEHEIPFAGSSENPSNEGHEEEEEVCYGLLDNSLYRSPEVCLMKTKETYGFDIVSEMNDAGLNLIERIRLVNHIRKLKSENLPTEDIIHRARAALSERNEEILDNDSLLIPVVEGDLLLTALETGDDLDDDSRREASAVRDAVEASLREERVIP